LPMSKTTIMRGFLATGSEGEISIGSQSRGSQVGNGKDRAGGALRQLLPQESARL
jgi:hypothetical protein